MNWSFIPIDHVRPTSSFDVSKEPDIKKAFKWKNIQLQLKKNNLQKVKESTLLDHTMQFVETYQFPRLNEEELNQDFYY